MNARLAVEAARIAWTVFGAVINHNGGADRATIVTAQALLNDEFYRLLERGSPKPDPAKVEPFQFRELKP